MPIFSPDTLDFFVTDIFLEKEIIHVSPKRWNISVGCIFMVYSRDTEAFWCHVVLKLHNKCTNQIASCIVFGCLYPSFCTGTSKQKLKKNLWSSYEFCSTFCVLYSANLCFFDKLQPIIAQFDLVLFTS